MAKLYRSQLRWQAAGPPNFAGHYTIARWGCGSQCGQFAIIDAKTGQVYFDPRIQHVDEINADNEEPIEFREDSTLLILTGNINEPRRTKSFFTWDGITLKLIRTVNCAALPAPCL